MFSFGGSTGVSSFSSSALFICSMTSSIVTVLLSIYHLFVCRLCKCSLHFTMNLVRSDNNN